MLPNPAFNTLALTAEETDGIDYFVGMNGGPGDQALQLRQIVLSGADADKLVFNGFYISHPSECYHAAGSDPPKDSDGSEAGGVARVDSEADSLRLKAIRRSGDRTDHGETGLADVFEGDGLGPGWLSEYPLCFQHGLGSCLSATTFEGRAQNGRGPGHAA
jgi:hypothetical protein